MSLNQILLTLNYLLYFIIKHFILKRYFILAIDLKQLTSARFHFLPFANIKRRLNLSLLIRIKNYIVLLHKFITN